MDGAMFLIFSEFLFTYLRLKIIRNMYQIEQFFLEN